MDTARWQQVKRVFQEALERPHEGRERYVSEAAAGDSSLEREVEALLAAHEDAGAFLASPTKGGATAAGDTDPAEVFARLQRALAGRYSIERELGRGGMAIVYLARDVALDRPVAVKLLPPHLAGDAAYRERFLREARTAAGLSHPNIVPIHLVEERDGLVYFVMAFVDGESLGDRVRRAGPLKPADAARLVQEVAWALAYAHGRGVIHRDIKPDNILLDKGSGRALVADFGIARVAATETVSGVGEVIGTLRYMSPEQSTADAAIDGRSDLYSLGVTAFFALTGRVPFDSENPVTLISMHLAEPAPPLLSVRAGLPAKLAEAVDRCLAKDPAARFASGELLAEAIADAKVMGRAVAPSVREFLAAAKAAVWQVPVLSALWWVALQALGSLVPNRPMIGHPLDPVFAMIAVFTVAVVLRPILTARGVLRAGLGEQDVAEAVASSHLVRDANVEYELARIERLGRLLSRSWVRAGLVALTGAFVFGMGSYIVGERHTLYEVAWAAVNLLAITAFFSGLVIVPRKMAALFTRGTKDNAAFLGTFWSGPVGRWFFRLAGLGLRRSSKGPSRVAEPTEVLLGRAAGALFDRLPKDLRTRLGDVQQVIGGLERAAASLRERRDALNEALADVGADDASSRRGKLVIELETTRAEVERRLGRAVGALENLRLDLLRLRAGVGGPDDLTRSIEEAHVVREAVEREIEAKREVEAVIAAV